ncbi:hypothetical protein J3F83DRAFT_748766 [Trichoderma novae-zelandiae]
MLRPLGLGPGDKLRIVQCLHTRLRPVEAHALCEETWLSSISAAPVTAAPAFQHQHPARGVPLGIGEGVHCAMLPRASNAHSRPCPSSSPLPALAARRQGSNFES